jgi:hypothetical protein
MCQRVFQYFITQVVVAAGFEADTGQTVDHFRVIIDIHEEHEPVFPDLNGMGGPVNLGQLLIELLKLPHGSDHAGVAAAKHKMVFELVFFDFVRFVRRHVQTPLLCSFFSGSAKRALWSFSSFLMRTSNWLTQKNIKHTTTNINMGISVAPNNNQNDN